MPGFYRPGEYDLSGTIVGVVEKARMLDGKGIRPGDAVIGLASSGLHTNGYSLARKIFFERLKLKPASFVRELGNTLGDELLKVHRELRPAGRASSCKSSIPPAPGARPAVKGLAHITGGGFIDNIPRVLPRNCDVLVRKGSWEVPPIFQFIQAKGGVDRGGAVPGVQHGHRHDDHRGRGQGGRGAAVYSRPKTSRLADRRSGSGHGHRPHDLKGRHEYI